MLTFIRLLVAFGLCATAIAICDVQKHVPALNRTDNSTTGILRLLREGDKLLEFEKEDEDMIVFMGLTGSGKTTFVLHLGGNDEDLTAVETRPRSGEFIIADQCNRSSSAAKTLESHTLIPDRFIDSETKLTYFDMPGFADSRPLVAYDIAATYFTKRVLDRARRVKVVFVINYSAVKVAEDRGRLTELAQHITTFLHDLSKFEGSIALVVSKVDNIFSYGTSADYPYVPDDVMIEGVAEFLSNARSSYSESNMTKEMQLMDILLHRKNDSFDRIGLFRRPNRPGPLKNVTVIQRSKKNMRTIIDQNIRFAETNPVDFGYTISEKSKNSLNKLKEERQRNAAGIIYAIGDRIREVFRGREDTATDLVDMASIFREETSLDTASCKTIADFSDQLDEFVRRATLDLAFDDLGVLRDDENIMNYLNQINAGTAIDWSPLIQNGMKETVEYLRDSRSWYTLFLNTTYDVLSSYEVQRARAEINSSTLLERITELEKRSQTNAVHLENEMLEFSKSTQIESLRQIYSSLKGVRLNKKKLIMFDKVLKATLQEDVNILCRGNKLTIKGKYIILSQIADDVYDCSEARFIEIVALERIYLDANLDFTGKEAQLFVIAPLWITVGQVGITLNGADAKRYESDAGSGVASAAQWKRNGKHGAPGLPGGSAGHFFGMGGHFINAEQLTIAAIGGNGGDGQRGGDGSPGTSRSEAKPYDGKDSADAIYPEYKRNEILVEESGFLRKMFYFLGVASDKKVYEVEITLPPGDRGGDGGNGGTGGIGGNEGKVTLFNYNTGKNCSAKILSQRGNDGIPGEAGRGAPGGDVGRTLVEKKTEEKFWWSGKFGYLEFWRYTDPSHPRAESGTSGDSGRNDVGLKYPATVNYAEFNTSIVEYKQYARDNLLNDVRRHIRTILYKLDATHR